MENKDGIKTSFVRKSYYERYLSNEMDQLSSYSILLG
jgi:hypothetical protein